MRRVSLLHLVKLENTPYLCLDPSTIEVNCILLVVLTAVKMALYLTLQCNQRHEPDCCSAKETLQSCPAAILEYVDSVTSAVESGGTDSSVTVDRSFSILMNEHESHTAEWA